MYRILYSGLSLAALAIALPAQAQTAQDLSEAEAADRNIVVTANRAERPVSEVGESVSVLTAQDIQTRQSATISDLIRTLPGVTLNRNGGPGTVAGLNVRGAETGQTVVLVDGVKINDPAAISGAYNLGTLMTGNIRRIELVRGSRSVVWGSQAIGGVLNMLTAAPTDELAIDARAEYGWRDTANAAGNVSGRVGPAAISAGGSYFRTDGYSAIASGTERDGYENYAANAKVAVDLTSALSIDLRGFYNHGKADIDGYLPDFTLGDTADTARTREWVGYAGLNLSLFDGKLRNRVAYAYTNVDRLDRDGDDAPTYDSLGENERVEYQGILDLNDMVSAVFGAEHEWSRFRAESFGTLSRADTEISSLYAEATVKPVSGLAITGGVRHDDHQRFGGATTFAASGVFSPNDGATTLRASWGEGFKAPSLYQLFSDYGNEGLRPETSQGWDVGLSQKLVGGALELGATWFRRVTSDQIGFAFCPPAATTAPCIDRPFGVYDNIERARSEGLEVVVAMHPTERFTVQGQYSFIDAIDRTTGLELARRPRHTASFVTDYAFPFGLSVGSTIQHVSGSFNDVANTQPLEGYVLVDLRAAIPVTDKFEIYGRIENVTDEKYQTILNYGTAGRAGYAGARLKL